MTHRTAEETKKANVAAMGEALGSQYTELWQEIVYLHRKWMEYLVLFGTKPSRIEILNKAAPAFFRMVQDLLWEETLLHIARLTDPPASGAGKSNLTIQSFPSLVTDAQLRGTIQSLIDKVLTRSEFCRDWRNRRIAHRDLALALDERVEPLKNGSRKQVDELLNIIADVMDTIQLHYFESGTYYRFDANRGGAVELLYVLDEGIRAHAAREGRIRSGKPIEDDYTTRDL